MICFHPNVLEREREWRSRPYSSSLPMTVLCVCVRSRFCCQSRVGIGVALASFRDGTFVSFILFPLPFFLPFFPSISHANLNSFEQTSIKMTHKQNPWKKSRAKMRWKWKKKRTRRLQRKRRKMRQRAR